MSTLKVEIKGRPERTITFQGKHQQTGYLAIPRGPRFLGTETEILAQKIR